MLRSEEEVLLEALALWPLKFPNGFRAGDVPIHDYLSRALYWVATYNPDAALIWPYWVKAIRLGTQPVRVDWDGVLERLLIAAAEDPSQSQQSTSLLFRIIHASAPIRYDDLTELSPEDLERLRIHYWTKALEIFDALWAAVEEYEHAQIHRG